MYAGASLWALGWLTAVFGPLHAFLATLIVAFPLLFMVRMARSDRPAKRREYVYLAVLTVLALVGARFLICVWYDHGVNRPVALERNLRSLRRYLANKPEYEHVTVCHKMGGLKGMDLHVVLGGSVRTRDVHDELMKTVNRGMRYADSVEDEVTYWGREAEEDEDAGSQADGEGDEDVR